MIERASQQNLPFLLRSKAVLILIITFVTGQRMKEGLSSTVVARLFSPSVDMPAKNKKVNLFLACKKMHPNIF